MWALSWLILAWMIERVQLVMCELNYGVPWNGCGAINGVLSRDAQAPMVYRVLVPWLMLPAKAAKLPMLESYEVVKIILTAGALWSVSNLWGWQVALLTAVLLPTTFLYDYWDWGPEIMGLMLAATGDIWLSMAGVIVVGLSRETSPLVAVAYLAVTGDLLGAAMLAVMAGSLYVLLRAIQGEHPLYCKRIMWADNLAAVKGIAQYRPWWLSSVAVSIAVSIMALFTALAVGWLGVIPLALVVAGWVFGRVQETRIFTGTLPFIAYAVHLWLL